MILKKQTEEKFGYTIDSLTQLSSKKISCRCDYCKCEYESTPKRIKIGREVVDKDACIKCKFKKREEVSLKRDGVKNSACRKEIKEKIKTTHTEKYGGYYVGTEEFKNRAQNTNVKKYGAKHILQTNKFQKITRETKIKNGHLTEYKGKLASEWAIEKGYSKVRYQELVKKYGHEVAIKMTPHQSSLETLFEEMLKSENIEYTKQVRVGNRIADFLVDNILIECNGLYWHSDANKTSEIANNDDYHINKKKLYTDNGYRSLFFLENELNNKLEICKSILFNKLKKNKRIFARKCQIKEVGKKESKEFFEQNHLMGSGRGKCLGLYYNNELVCCLQYYKKQNMIDISRFCCKNFISVVGGFSKLEKNMIGRENPSIIQNFIDCRYGDGAHLNQLGYTLSSCYKSFVWTDFQNTYHRMKFPSNSGYDNDLAKIWDCGQANFLKTL